MSNSPSADRVQKARTAIVDIMVVAEIMQALGREGSDPEDGDRVTATHVEWLGRCLSNLAGDAEAALSEMGPPPA